MVFVGVHGEWGRIDVTQADLGCGRDRASIYKTKRPAPLTCYECDWRLHLVHKTHGAYDLWFLRHANQAPHCEARAAGEGMAHHLLKLDLAHHARAAGWSAEYEVAAPDGSWRADVMATSPDGSRRVALEAQMASISIADIEARTDRYGEAGVEVCWFTDRKTAPWLENVPSVQIARPDDGDPVQVTAGPARFEPAWCDDRTACDWCDREDCGAGVGPLPCEGHGKWEPAAPFPLERFVAAICQNATRPHRLRVGWDTKGKWRWITRRYFDMEEEQFQAHIRKYQIVERLQAVQQRQQKARQAAEQEHVAAIEALLQRQKALIKPVTEFIYHEAGAYPSVARDGSPEFAMGVPVHLGGKPYAVICPVASRVPALRRRLAPLVLFAASERERSRILAQAAPGQRIEVLTAAVTPTSTPEVPPQPAQGGLTVRQAVNRMFGLDRM
ncbi:competence protein CoiA family protein [Streptomyces sp. NBC_00199]|uniref:competence protein CoiA family protein n=1 Tax=Streptomyces sp. NBC_00199 TaxID=2975678 RepID=UPI00224F5E50|nr:competence protein CoiA family protein [Streptomyces sp. NBC_00199]MCX5264938.1 competence protein CoiA family protein [Streptomyces sp. NBC_00199]